MAEVELRLLRRGARGGAGQLAIGDHRRGALVGGGDGARLDRLAREGQRLVTIVDRRRRFLARRPAGQAPFADLQLQAARPDDDTRDRRGKPDDARAPTPTPPHCRQAAAPIAQRATRRQADDPAPPRREASAPHRRRRTTGRSRSARHRSRHRVASAASGPAAGRATAASRRSARSAATARPRGRAASAPCRRNQAPGVPIRLRGAAPEAVLSAPSPAA